jgi:hypothetical protein
MSMVITLPDEMVRRLESVAAARGETIEELALEALDVSPLLTDPTPVEGQARPRRRLALAGIGSSGGPGISDRIDELLAEGFGRDDA